jgi:hypothetical protein
MATCAVQVVGHSLAEQQLAQRLQLQHECALALAQPAAVDRAAANMHPPPPMPTSLLAPEAPMPRKRAAEGEVRSAEGLAMARLDAALVDAEHRVVRTSFGIVGQDTHEEAFTHQLEGKGADSGVVLVVNNSETEHLAAVEAASEGRDERESSENERAEGANREGDGGSRKGTDWRQLQGHHAVAVGAFPALVSLAAWKGMQLHDVAKLVVGMDRTAVATLQLEYAEAWQGVNEREEQSQRSWR